MKKQRIVFIAVVLLMVTIFSSCTTSLNKSVSFNVSTGDQIKVTVDAKAGYDITMKSPFEVMKDGETVVNGSFATEEAFDGLSETVDSDEKATLIDKGKKDGNDYLFYSYEGAAGTEYNYIMKVGESKTVIIMSSLKDEDEAKKAYEAIKAVKS